MPVPELVQMELLSTPDIIKEFEREAEASPDDITILSSGEEKDQTLLGFGLVEVGTAIAVIKGAYWVGSMAAKLYKWLSERNRRIVVQTPLGRAEFISSSDLTEAEIKNVLQGLAGINK